MRNLDKIVSKFEHVCNVSVDNANLLTVLKTRQELIIYRETIMSIYDKFTKLGEYIFL